jgi:hypothetical protein
MKNTFLLLFLVSITSCLHEPQAHQLNEYKLDLGFGKGKNVEASSYIKTIEFCQPEYNEGFYFSSHSKIIGTPTRLIIFNPNTKKIACFNKSGKFQNYIGGIGSGPGEYSSVMDLCIDSTKDIIFVYDYVNNKIIHYRLNGDYIGYTPCKTHSHKLVFHNNKFVLYNPRPTQCFADDYAITILSIEGRILQKLSKREKESPLEKPALFSSLYVLNDTICFWDSYSDTVFFIDNKKTSPKFKFDLGKRKIPEKLFESNSLFFQEYRNYDNISGFIETSKFIFAWGHSRDVPKLISVIKKTKQIENVFVQYGNHGLVNDLNEGPDFFPQFVISNDDVLQIIPVDQLDYSASSVIKLDNKGNPLISIATFR